MTKLNSLSKDGVIVKTFRVRNEYAQILEEIAAKKEISASALLDNVLRESQIIREDIVRGWVNPV